MKIKLINCPEVIIPLSWQKKYKLKLLEINGKSKVISGLLDIKTKDEKDFKKLLKNLKLQLETKGILRNSTKVQVGKQKGQKEIIEIKATRGHSRLFAFFSENKELIICTHTYWKTATNKKQQNSEFAKAAEMRNLYIDNLE
ncbi:hypothetical protein KAH27_04575 [bacterium]|nr:hypothetical protein [bacterium]